MSFCLLDDFLLTNLSVDTLKRETAEILKLFQGLGIQINWKKSSLIPRQRLEYLGVIFDFRKMTLSLPKDKVSNIIKEVNSTLAKTFCTRRDLESLLGLLNFAALYLPLGRLHLLPLMQWNNAHTRAKHRDLPVTLPPLFKKLLIPWTDPSFLSQSVSIRLKTPSTILMTDASKSGWGGICLPFATSGHWPMDLRHRSMNYLELKAIQNTIQHFAKTLKGKTVTLLTDNTTAAACIRRQGTLRSPSLLSLTTQILLKCKSYKINLVPKYLPGRLNVLADSASRSSPIHGEWALDANTFRHLWRNHGPFQVDLFSNRYNAQLETFISPYPDPLAAGENAFSLDWNQWVSLYAFPPTKVLPLVVQRLHHFRGQGVLIAPYHPISTWFPSLMIRCPLHYPLPHPFAYSRR